MIIVRIGLATDNEFSPPVTDGPTSGLEFASSPGPSRRPTYRAGRDQGPPKSLALELTHYLDMDGDIELDRDSKGLRDLTGVTSEETTRHRRSTGPD